MVGHEAFWSTVAQTLAVVGGATLIAIAAAWRRLEGDPAIRVMIGYFAIVYGGLYVILETIALLVLASGLDDTMQLRGNVIIGTVVLMIIGAIGWRFFVVMTRVVDRAGSAAAHATTRAAAAARRAGDRAVRRARLLRALRARRRRHEAARRAPAVGDRA